MRDEEVIFELENDDFVLLEQLLSERICEMKSKLNMIDESKYLHICKLRGFMSGMVDLLEI